MPVQTQSEGSTPDRPMKHEPADDPAFETTKPPATRWPLLVLAFGCVLTIGWIIGLAYALLWLVDVV